MGNSFAGKRRNTAKIMKIDGSVFRLKPPVSAGELLRDHPGHSVLDAEEVKSAGIRACPLAAADPLLPGRLYFLVLLPRLPHKENPRRTYSGNIRVTAKDRLESLAVSRRAFSDRALHYRPAVAVSESSIEGGMQVRVRLPKADVARLVEESRDSNEAAQKIMELAASMKARSNHVVARKEKRTRFMQTTATIIA